MAGLITHMVIAQEITKRLPQGTITEEGLFYLGNLGPDSIHSREGYIRAMKKHTHLRDDILDPEFEQEENLTLFHQRVADFINQHKDRKDGLLDLYRGYVTHLLADELFMLTLRKEFCQVMEAQQIPQNNTVFFDYIVTDMNRSDLLLVDRYQGSQQIREKLEQVAIYPIEGYLSIQEMRDSRDWLIRRHFIEAHEFLEPRYISYEKTLDFINAAADSIVMSLSGDGSLPAMF